MQNAKSYKALGGFGTIGLEVVLSILFGLWLGSKLDDWLGTKPWMSVLWFGFGCAAAARSFYRAWKSMQLAAKREEAEEGNPAQLFPDDKSLAWKREEDRATGGEALSPGSPDSPAEQSPLDKPGDGAKVEDRAEKRDE